MIDDDKVKMITKMEDFEWPADSMFYVLGQDGLMVCRNHEFFTSCAPARHGPPELMEQKPFITIKYPKIPADLFAQAVGFFHDAEEPFGEAYIALMCHKEHGVKFVIPPQECSPGSVHYDTPQPDGGWRMFGDIHSHGNMGAFASFTDTHDEDYRPGLHIVVGHVGEPSWWDKKQKRKIEPEFHIEAVVDGHRFKVTDLEMVVEGGFIGRDPDYPSEWFSMLKKKVWKSYGYQGTHHREHMGYYD